MNSNNVKIYHEKMDRFHICTYEIFMEIYNKFGWIMIEHVCCDNPDIERTLYNNSTDNVLGDTDVIFICKNCKKRKNI